MPGPHRSIPPITLQSSSETYQSFRTRSERVALGLVLAVVLGLPLAIFGYRAINATGPTRVIELTGRLPTTEHGGWAPEIITVQKGERVRLRLTSADVVHGFSIPKLGVDAGWVEPGKVQEIEFVAGQAGRYTYLCTVWCQDGHWRMRGILQVVDPADPAASEQDVDPPRTNWMAAGIDVDADHPGEFVPAAIPEAAAGARVWSQISARPVAEAMADLDLRHRSPSQVYQLLSTPGLPESAALAELSPAARWDVVAFLWSATTTPAALQLGQQLYQRDCVGCHGPEGRGDGPGAAALAPQHAMPEGPIPHRMNQGIPGMEMPGMDRPVVDFTDLAARSGASDLLYYGKLVRGGMGTSMPYSGTIYTEEELRAVIAQLRSFAFAYFSEP